MLDFYMLCSKDEQKHEGTSMNFALTNVFVTIENVELFVIFIKKIQDIFECCESCCPKSRELVERYYHCQVTSY